MRKGARVRHRATGVVGTVVEEVNADATRVAWDEGGPGIAWTRDLTPADQHAREGVYRATIVVRIDNTATSSTEGQRSVGFLLGGTGSVDALVARALRDAPSVAEWEAF